MKPTLIALLLLAAGCGDPNRIEQPTVPENKEAFTIAWEERGFIQSETFTVVLIDSCEYLAAVYDRSMTLTHKGNCKNH